MARRRQAHPPIRRQGPSKRRRRSRAYTTALRHFTESCHKLNTEDIDRKDLLKFCAFLRDEKEPAPRSVYHKFENLMAFLNGHPGEGEHRCFPAGREFLHLRGSDS